MKGKNSSTSSDKFFEYYAIFLTMCSITSFHFLWNENLLYVVVWIGILMFFVFFTPYLRKDLNTVGVLYCIAITIGFVFRRIDGFEVKFFSDVLVRIVPVFMLLHYKDYKNFSNKKIQIFLLSFFVLECVLAIYEKLTLNHWIDYQSESQAMNVDMFFSEDFRSFSLMGHPLRNANVVSIILAFIVCSSTINKIPKILFVLLGLGAIWAFNSRASLAIWLLLIFYRVFLYGKSFKWWLTYIVILLVALPSIILYIQNSGVLGRLTFDFSDGSTMTRILAVEIFLTYPWSLKDMLFGGVLLEYPSSGGWGVADYMPIENGYLFDLGYWGLVLGGIKIFGEIMISYIVLKNFQIRDKFFIMIAIWGIASMNNNTLYTFLMPFYMCSYLAFGVNQKELYPQTS